MLWSLVTGHRLVGLGPTGVTRLEVVILPTEVFLNDDWESLGVVFNTFLVLAVVGFM